MTDERALVFRLNDTGQGPELLRHVFLERGWVEFVQGDDEEHKWNLWWRTSRFRSSDYDQIYSWQRLNHYPKSTAITKKDSLARNLRRMKGVHGSAIYNFSPVAFNLPNDYTKFVAEYTRMKDKFSSDKPTYWIVKPADLSRGRGIVIFRDLAELQYDCSAVVQQYVTSPLLISGYKFDLRIYVMVPSFHPLTIYIYEEGLVRFSTEKYDLGCLSNVYAHLTNSSINKHGPSYTADKERIGLGCKWTLTQLRHYLRQVSIDDDVLWVRITNIIILTLLVQSHQVPNIQNCFELYGFDIIIDENAKPWLLEVNFSPALGSDCQTDVIVKKPMIHDMIDMLQLKEEDKDHGGKNFKPAAKFGWTFHHKPYRRKSGKPNGKLKQAAPGKIEETTFLRGRSYSTAQKSTDIVSEVSVNKYEKSVETTLPGCGLPKVQQLTRLPSSGSSGRSSSSCKDSLVSVEGNDPILRPHQRNNSQLILGKAARTNLPHVSSAESLPPRCPQKRDSKVSIHSDSAISSYSGSSDNSDRFSIPEDIALQNHQHSETNKQANRQNLVDRPDLNTPKKRLTTNAVGMVSEKNIVNSVSQNELKTSIGQDHVSTSFSTTSLSSSHPAAIHVKDSTKSNNMQLPRQPTFTANPLLTKSATFNRRGSLRTSQGAPRRPAHFVRPLQRQRNYISESLSTSKLKSQAPAERIGDFTLAYPFNDVTRRCNSVDARVAIRECQKLLKERTTKTFNKQSTRADEPACHERPSHLQRSATSLTGKPNRVN